MARFKLYTGDKSMKFKRFNYKRFVWAIIALIIALIITLTIIILVVHLTNKNTKTLSLKKNGVSMTVKPSKLNIKELEKSELVTLSLTIRDSKDFVKRLGINKSEPITVKLVFNASNPNYLWVIDPLTSKKIDFKLIDIVPEDNAIAVNQFRISGKKVPGQKTSPWSLQISAIVKSKPIISTTIDISIS